MLSQQAGDWAVRYVLHQCQHRSRAPKKHQKFVIGLQPRDLPTKLFDVAVRPKVQRRRPLAAVGAVARGH